MTQDSRECDQRNHQRVLAQGRDQHLSPYNAAHQRRGEVARVLRFAKRVTL